MVLSKKLMFYRQVTVKRLRVIQKKVVMNESFSESRGKYVRSNKIVTKEMKAPMNAHLLAIPHHKSHYTRSNLLYFERSDITIRQLHAFYSFAHVLSSPSSHISTGVNQ